ncbi:MAG: protein phosphatase 2C domain-containing protein [Christensenellales bacterium]
MIGSGNMIAYFTKTNIGYSHIKENKCCQDYSACYHDEERTIITACDGHGGDIYIRSHFGSKFASNAVVSVLKELERSDFYKYSRTDICNKLRLKILCEWNAMVEKHLSEKHLSKREVLHLNEDKLFKLKQNPEKAYGTTLNAAMIFGNKLVCVSIGDGGVIIVRKGEIALALPDDEEAVANTTCSMCQEDAYEHLKIEIYDFSDFDGVVVCTDGLINPYQSMGNFRDKFIKPICLKIQDGKQVEIDDFIVSVGEKIGIGDDVSFGIAMKTGISLRSYRK